MSLVLMGDPDLLWNQDDKHLIRIEWVVENIGSAALKLDRLWTWVHPAFGVAEDQFQKYDETLLPAQPKFGSTDIRFHHDGSCGTICDLVKDMSPFRVKLEFSWGSDGEPPDAVVRWDGDIDGRIAIFGTA